MTRQQTLKRLQSDVLDEFVTTHQPVTVIKLHEMTGYSKTYLRQVLRRSKQLRRTTWFHRIYSQDDPNHIHQTREVEAYVPSREWLAELFSESRRKLQYKSYNY